MRIFLISNMFPSEKQAAYGVFVANIKRNLEREGASISRLSLIKNRGQTKLSKAFKYLKYYLSVIFNYSKSDFDIFYVHFLSHNTPVLLFLDRFFKRKSKWVINIHGSDVTQSKGKSIDKYNLKILEKADKIIVPSDYFKALMLDQYPSVLEAKYFVSASGGVPSDIFYLEKQKYARKDKFLIGYVSRMDKGKGWDLFLTALSSLKQNKISFQTVMIGSGEEELQVQQMIQDLELTEVIKSYPGMSQEELAEHYRSFDVFVFPSILDESLGLVGLEAMACGTPVIGTDNAGIASYVKHAKNGYLFEKTSAEDLYQNLKQIIELSETTYVEMRKQAYKTAEYYFDYNQGKALYQEFENLIKKEQ